MHSAQQMSTRAHPAAIFSTKLQRFPNMGLTVKSSDDLWPWSRHHTGDTWGWSLVTTFHRSLDTCSSDTNTGALPLSVSECVTISGKLNHQRLETGSEFGVAPGCLTKSG